MTGKVTVFGSINLDLIAHVGHLPQPGETVTGGNFLSAPGGKGANQALAAARAGAQTTLLGAIGQDAFAEQTLPLLKAAGVDLGRLARLNASTGTALILVDGKGENLIAVASGANYELSLSALDGFTPSGDTVFLSQLEMDLEVTAEVLKRARAAGARVLLNLAPFRPEVVRFLGEADLLLLNEGEAASLAGCLGLGAMPDVRLCPSLAEATQRDVVITLGARGLVAHIAGRPIALPAPEISAIDTVGAGDAFCGFLAAHLAKAGQVDAAGLSFAATAGALTCTRQGAQTAIPTRLEVEALLR
ncbi:MAG: ribokinase [Kiloniellales bacterium]